MLLSSGFARQDAGDLICSDRLAEVLTELRHEFPLVVIDSPPILPYADGRVISSLTDGVIFIGRSGVTTRQAVKRSLELLEQAHSAPVLDVVLNAVNVENWEYRYSYGSHYGRKGE
jgi:Mrp family chromosome partitioning ATPase